MTEESRPQNLNTGLNFANCSAKNGTRGGGGGIIVLHFVRRGDLEFVKRDANENVEKHQF